MASSPRVYGRSCSRSRRISIGGPPRSIRMLVGSDRGGRESIPDQGRRRKPGLSPPSCTMRQIVASSLLLFWALTCQERLGRSGRARRAPPKRLTNVLFERAEIAGGCSEGGQGTGPSDHPKCCYVESDPDTRVANEIKSILSK